MRSDKKKASIQIAIGSNIAQASGEGAIAQVEINQPSPRLSPATAPIPPPHFAGRQSELEYLNLALTKKEGPSRLCAIVGMGGVGKTALALKTAEVLKNDFPGGIFWGDLGETNGNPLPIISYWELLCGDELSKTPDLKTRVQNLRAILLNRQTRNGRILFILDDVRFSWIESARSLKNCFPSNASVLITTREIQVTQALRASPYYLKVLSVSDSHELITKLSEGQITHTEANQIAEACGLIPLAIELATAIAMQEGVEWLLDELKDSKQRLETLSLDNPIHKDESVRLSFDISYQALCERHPETARVFRWLGVFANYNLCPARITGVLTENEKKVLYNSEARFLIDFVGRIPSRVEASKIAEDIEKNDPSDEAKIVADICRKAIAWPEESEFNEIDLSLRRLDKWNLFRHHPPHGEKGDHYSIHPLLKDYAAYLLGVVGDLQSARKAFVTHYLKFVWTYPKVSSISLLGAEYSNILTAIDYSYQDENWEDYFRFVKLFCLDKGSFSQLFSINEKCFRLKQAESLAERLQDKEKIIIFGYTYSNLLLLIGNFELSLVEHQRIHSLLEESGNLGLIASSNMSLGELALDMNNIDDAERLLTVSLDTYEKLGDKHGIGSVLGELGLVYIKRKDYYKARGNLERSIAIFQELKDEEGEGTSLFQLAYLNEKEGSYSEAEKLYRILLRRAEDKGDLLDVAKCSVNLANIFDNKKDFSNALALMEKAYEIFDSCKSPYADKIRPSLEELRNTAH